MKPRYVITFYAATVGLTFLSSCGSGKPSLKKQTIIKSKKQEEIKRNKEALLKARRGVIPEDFKTYLNDRKNLEGGDLTVSRYKALNSLRLGAVNALDAQDSAIAIKYAKIGSIFFPSYSLFPIILRNAIDVFTKVVSEASNRGVSCKKLSNHLNFLKLTAPDRFLSTKTKCKVSKPNVNKNITTRIVNNKPPQRYSKFERKYSMNISKNFEYMIEIEKIDNTKEFKHLTIDVFDVYSFRPTEFRVEKTNNSYSIYFPFQHTPRKSLDEYCKNVAVLMSVPRDGVKCMCPTGIDESDQYNTKYLGVYFNSNKRMKCKFQNKTFSFPIFGLAVDIKFEYENGKKKIITSFGTSTYLGSTSNYVENINRPNLSQLYWRQEQYKRLKTKKSYNKFHKQFERFGRNVEVHWPQPSTKKGMPKEAEIRNVPESYFKGLKTVSFKLNKELTYLINEKR